jgi:hypothetical protein
MPVRSRGCLSGRRWCEPIREQAGDQGPYNVVGLLVERLARQLAQRSSGGQRGKAVDSRPAGDGHRERLLRLEDAERDERGHGVDEELVRCASPVTSRRLHRGMSEREQPEHRHLERARLVERVVDVAEAHGTEHGRRAFEVRAGGHLRLAMLDRPRHVGQCESADGEREVLVTREMAVRGAGRNTGPPGGRS